MGRMPEASAGLHVVNLGCVQEPEARRGVAASTEFSQKAAHERGECRPCAYFWQKEDGCRLGDECVFCHSCDSEALKRLKKQKRQKMRLNRRAPLKEEESAEAEELAVELDLYTEPAKVLHSESLTILSTPPGFPARAYMPAHVYLKERISSPSLAECNVQLRKLMEETTPSSSSQPQSPVLPGRTRLNLGRALQFHPNEEPMPESHPGPSVQLKFQDMFPELGFLLRASQIAPPPNLPPPDQGPWFAPRPNLPAPDQVARGAGARILF